MKSIDAALRDALCRQARVATRRRAHHLIHESREEPVQRMLIALQPGTYIRPHCHRSPPKWELGLVLQGDAAWLFFDDQGRLTARTESDADTGPLGLEYGPGTWHSLLCLAPDTLLFECKPGPFAPVAPQDFAPWAPVEGTEETADCLAWMWRARPGERYGGPTG